jgi:ferredoxin
MKHALIYFTSTGNSLAVAQALASSLGQAELVGMPGALQNKKVIKAETVGLVFPVYCWGLPKLVFEFLQTVDLQAQYVYAVVTYGGVPGPTNLQLKDVLSKKGIELKAGFGLHMPGNYTPMYGAPAENTQQKYFTKMSARIPEITTVVKQQLSGKLENGPWIVDLLIRLTGFYKLFLAQVANSDKAFIVQENCNSCGICAKICPVNNIVMKNNRPEWQHHCENCMGCLQWCPEEAIQYGKATLGRKRYHYPQLTWQDLLKQKQ